MSIGRPCPDCRNSSASCKTGTHFYVYGIDPYLAHQAFLLTDEYQTIIKNMGAGPDKGEPGHDPDVGYGSVVRGTWPRVNIVRGAGGATHFWPDTVAQVLSAVEAR